jgi:Icc protein
VMGNHDERAAYSAALFDAESDDPQDRVYDVAGLRIVALDTSVPGWHHGELGDDQLGWLADVLATPAPHGTVLALHHPPIPVPMMRVAEIIELLDQHRLAPLVRRSDVRAIIGGHYHLTSWSTFAGVPVSVASASCYTSEVAPDQRFLSAVDAHQAFTMLHLYDEAADHAVVHTVVPLADAPEVSGYGLDVVEPLAGLSPEERFDLVSRKDSWLNSPP